MTSHAYNSLTKPGASRPESRPLLQRQCACGQHTPGSGECAECKKKRLGLQRAPISYPGIGEAGVDVPPIVHEVLRSPGQTLDQATLAYMEPRFGHDFSRVRVHTGERAAASARAVDALAYTVGHEIVFGARQYSPQAQSGRKLIGHELVHVIQQESIPATPQARLKVGPAYDPAEAQAEQVANKIASQDSPATQELLPAVPSIQRVCGPSAIGTPSGCTVPPDYGFFITGQPLFKFDVNCDDFATGEDLALAAFATSLPSPATFEIHGYASTDGNPDFNHNLACARALKAQALLTGAGINPSRITGVFNHGQAPGPAAERRSVVIRPARTTLITHQFRATAFSFLSCALCNPFTDDGTLGISPPTTEPSTSSSFRQMHFMVATLGTFDGQTIHPGTAGLASSGQTVGISGFCGTRSRAYIVSVTPPGAPTPVTSSTHGQGIQFDSELHSRVGAVVPATLPGAPCGYLGTNPMIPVIGNTFRMRLFADGTKESEFVSASLYPSHFLYEDGA